MTRGEAIGHIKDVICENNTIKPNIVVFEQEKEALYMAIKALEQEPIDKSAMMYEIYMEGVNMTGEYQGCWVKFKDIEKIVDKYMGDKE